MNVGAMYTHMLCPSLACKVQRMINHSSILHRQACNCYIRTGRYLLVHLSLGSDLRLLVCQLIAQL